MYKLDSFYIFKYRQPAIRLSFVKGEERLNFDLSNRLILPIRSILTLSEKTRIGRSFPDGFEVEMMVTQLSLTQIEERVLLACKKYLLKISGLNDV
jgi:hypothetical protein